MTLEAVTAADRGRIVYESLLLLSSRLQDPATRLSSAELLSYQKVVQEALPHLESISGTKFSNPQGLLNTIDDDRAMLMGRMIREVHQVVQNKLGAPQYTIEIDEKSRRYILKINYVVHTLLAKVKVPDGKVYFFALSTKGQYAFSEEAYWEPVLDATEGNAARASFD